MGKGSVGLLWVGFCIVVKEMFLAPDPYSLRQENWLLSCPMTALLRAGAEEETYWFWSSCPARTAGLLVRKKCQEEEGGLRSSHLPPGSGGSLASNSWQLILRCRGAAFGINHPLKPVPITDAAAGGQICSVVPDTQLIPPYRLLMGTNSPASTLTDRSLLQTPRAEPAPARG
ncbi:hypothetical protein Anapl_14346 [Anas platyrhynchos]|uniref:Uncharacterized protein n=1 Tax=Anas platyrhynchos TaxID=8839 RepID=R0KWE3_ANAPL|nr:hypothetical protein Anapl_14346 [Anas platyrhynchos]